MAALTSITVALGERSYPVYVGGGALEALGDLYAKHGLGPRAAIVTDKNVEKVHGRRVLLLLKDASVDAQLIPIPPGESSKSARWADRLYTRLIWGGYDREATIVALGGGMVGDLAGFVAATYLRGVRWVQVPTTLLAQVDAAIGGKTGINHRLGKNLIGAFHQPRFVLADPDTLESLPRRELGSGLAETAKYGLIRDAELFAELEAEVAGGRKIEQGRTQGNRLATWVERSVRIKSEIVSRDERESGERALLNFGHTLGHALEVASEGRLLHGEAVAWGMLGEAWISRERRWLPQRSLDRVRALVRDLGAPSLSHDLEIDPLIAYIHRDKKTRGGRIRAVLLREIGRAEMAEVSEAEMRRALSFLTNP